MARLTDDQWLEIRADYEVRHTSNRELASKHGVTEAAIRKKAKQQGWIKEGSSHLVDKKTNIIKELHDLSSQSSQLSSHHLAAIDDEVSFTLQNNSDLQLIQNRINLMVDQVENPAHLLALMSATVKHREARLGKSPETAIQINNNTNQDHSSTALELLAIKRKLQDQ